VVDEVGDPSRQVSAGQRVTVELGAGAGDEPDFRLAAGRELLQLAAEHRVAHAAHPVDKGEVAGGGGQRLQQRPQRRDAGPARDQQHLAVAADRPGERAVGALGHHTRAWPQREQGAAVVPGRLDRDAQPVVAGRR
jgi:hypothetical protein